MEEGLEMQIHARVAVSCSSNGSDPNCSIYMHTSQKDIRNSTNHSKKMSVSRSKETTPDTVLSNPITPFDPSLFL
jgi:hypothetical protein